MRQSLPLLFTALAGFGVLAALFGPIKYGILPDHLRREQLPAGNALIEGATFIAILLGTIVGGLASRGGGDAAAFAALVMGFALACWLSALLIPPSGQGAPQLQVTANIAASTAAMIRHLRADKRLWWGAMVTSWFWLTGIVVLALLPTLIKVLIGGDEDTVTAYLALFSIAVGIGSGLAAAIARGRIVLMTTVAGGVLIAAFALDLGLATLGADAGGRAARTGRRCLPARSAYARRSISPASPIAGGLFIVPAFAAVQAWAGADYRARTVAAVNVLNAAFMTGGDHRRGGVAALRRHGAGAVHRGRRGDAAGGAGDLEDDAEADLRRRRRRVKLVPVTRLGITMPASSGWPGQPGLTITTSASPARDRPSLRPRRDNSPGRPASPAPCGRRIS